MNGAASMTVGALHAKHIGDRLLGAADATVRGVQHDSRAVRPGDLFVAIVGEQHDGADFAGRAVESGAVAVLAERELSLPVPMLISQDARRDLALAAELVYGRPTSSLRTVGVTGTNGKTTVTHLLEEVAAGVGARPALLGTTGARVAGETLPAMHTTPEGDDISRFAKRAVDAECTHLLMEVSSHGLALHRVDGVTFDVAAFTNLSQDHLDFHGTLDEYGQAKLRLFTELGSRIAVINIDDDFGKTLCDRVTDPKVRCSARGDADADVHVVSSTFDRSGISAVFQTPSGRLEIESPLVGEHNLENLAITLGCAEALALPADRVVEALADAGGAPGRLERITTNEPFDIFVDYAHTPDALRRVLGALRPLAAGRLIVVFGAGGDRDRSKRPLMGEQAIGGADLVVITSDNPRTEAPERIVDEIEEGARRAGGVAIDSATLVSGDRGFTTVLDRRQAIALAASAAADGDIVLLAGKGHETVQIVGDQSLPFDDREEARHAIARRGRA